MTQALHDGVSEWLPKARARLPELTQIIYGLRGLNTSALKYKWDQNAREQTLAVVTESLAQPLEAFTLNEWVQIWGLFKRLSRASMIAQKYKRRTEYIREALF